MKLLKGIGAAFVKLWRWIKETAWVQPLLIVGCIFAIIFSIPYFTKWVEQLSAGNSSAYYQAYQISLNNETTGRTDVTDLDRFTNSIISGSHFEDEGTDYDNTYGDKFFVAFVGEDCSPCNTTQPAFELLQENWRGVYAPEDGRDFKLYAIFEDEESDNDDQDQNGYTAFERYLMNYDEFFSEAGGRLQDAPYCYNASLTSSSDYTNFTNADTDAFPVPTILLVDYSPEAIALGRQGVSEILFSVSGESKYDKASLLMKMWNHTTTTDNTNKFSEYYGNK